VFDGEMNRAWCASVVLSRYGAKMSYRDDILAPTRKRAGGGFEDKIY